MRLSPVLLLALLAPACSNLAPVRDPAPIVRGPLTTRQQHPMALTLMAFRPRRPVTQEAGELGHAVQFAWSTIEEVQEFPDYSPGDSVVFDAETLRGTYRTRYGLNSRMDLEVEIPFLYAGSGAMDSLVEAFHDLFSLPKGGRDENEDDRYEVGVTSDGNELYALESYEIGLQDIPIFLTYLFNEESAGSPALAARVGVEFPTGSESKGYGNGAFDFGVGVLGEKSFGRWTLTGALDFTVPGQSDRMDQTPDHHYDPQFAVEFGTEYRWTDNLSVIVGTVWTSRMLHTVSLEEIDREVFDLGFGFAADVGEDSRFAFSLHEDIVSATGSDLTLQLGWVWGY